MVEGQLLRREPRRAILTMEAVAEENVEAGERRFTGLRDILFECDDAWKPHFEARASNHMVVFGDDVHSVEEHGLDGILPGPERKRKITERPEIGVENEGWRRSQVRSPRCPPAAATESNQRPGCRETDPSRHLNLRPQHVVVRPKGHLLYPLSSAEISRSINLARSV